MLTAADRALVVSVTIALGEATDRATVEALEIVAHEDPPAVTRALVLFTRAVRRVAENAPEPEVHATVRDLVRQLAAIRDRAAVRRRMAA